MLLLQVKTSSTIELSKLCCVLKFHVLLEMYIFTFDCIFCSFNVEIKSVGSYFMTSIKGRYFWRIMDEHGVVSFINP